MLNTCIVIVFLDFLSAFFNSLSFHCSIPVPYLNSAIAHIFIAVVLFFPFSFHFRISRSIRLIYSFIAFVFSFHPLWPYPILLYLNMCILNFQPPSLLLFLLLLLSWDSLQLSILAGHTTSSYLSSLPQLIDRKDLLRICAVPNKADNRVYLGSPVTSQSFSRIFRGPL